jgi:hypothetical protein
MLTIAGILAVIAFITSDVGKLTTGGLLIFLAESFVGMLLIAALLGVFK